MFEIHHDGATRGCKSPARNRTRAGSRIDGVIGGLGQGDAVHDDCAGAALLEGNRLRRSGAENYRSEREGTSQTQGCPLPLQGNGLRGTEISVVVEDKVTGSYSAGGGREVDIHRTGL